MYRKRFGLTGHPMPKNAQGKTFFEKSPNYERLRRHVTAERVKAHFAEIVRGDVVRYELPRIGALNFVMHNALGGGVTRTLALDIHGKSLSSALMDLEIPDDE